VDGRFIDSPRRGAVQELFYACDGNALVQPERVDDRGQDVGGLYFARQDLIGLFVPDALANKARQILEAAQSAGS